MKKMATPNVGEHIVVEHTDDKKARMVLLLSCDQVIPLMEKRSYVPWNSLG